MNQLEMAAKILEILREARATAASGTTFSSHQMRDCLRAAGCSAEDERREYTTVLSHLKRQGLITVHETSPLQLQLR